MAVSTATGTDRRVRASVIGNDSAGGESEGMVKVVTGLTQNVTTVMGHGITLQAYPGSLVFPRSFTAAGWFMS